MKFDRNQILVGLGLVMGSLLLKNCMNSSKQEYNESFPHIKFLDNPQQFKGDTLISTFHYDGTGHDMFKLGDMYQRYNEGESEQNLFEGYRFETGTSKNRLDVVFELSKGLKVPNVSHPDIIDIKFVCTQGNHRYGNKVISITR
jgi:hypothetical protein